MVRIVNFPGGVNYTRQRHLRRARRRSGRPRKESWTFTCEGIDGKVGATHHDHRSTAARARSVDFSKACAGGRRPRFCVSTKGGAKGTGIGVARLGRNRTKQRKTLEGTLLSDRKGIDRYCLKKGGGSLRVGYPTSRLSSKLSKKTRKRIKSKAIYMGTTSKAFSISKLKVGSKTKTLRKRLKGERRYVVGKNVWYVAKGKKARDPVPGAQEQGAGAGPGRQAPDRHEDRHRPPAARVGQARQDEGEGQEEEQGEVEDRSRGVRPRLTARTNERAEGGSRAGKTTASLPD